MGFLNQTKEEAKKHIQPMPEYVVSFWRPSLTNRAQAIFVSSVSKKIKR